MRTIDGIGLYQLRACRSMIDLLDAADAPVAPPGSEGGNLDHLVLQVDPFDAEAIGAHLSTHGITPGPVEKRYGAEGSGASMYIHDPDGNMVERKGPPNG